MVRQVRRQVRQVRHLMKLQWNGCLLRKTCAKVSQPYNGAGRPDYVSVTGHMSPFRVLDEIFAAEWLMIHLLSELSSMYAVNCSSVS